LISGVCGAAGAAPEGEAGAAAIPGGGGGAIICPAAGAAGAAPSGLARNKPMRPAPQLSQRSGALGRRTSAPQLLQTNVFISIRRVAPWEYA
jgi:hypothetical protein